MKEKSENEVDCIDRDCFVHGRWDSSDQFEFLFCRRLRSDERGNT